MKLGVNADIHGNDVALRAVLEDAGRFGRRHPQAEFVASVLTGRHLMLTEVRHVVV